MTDLTDERLEEIRGLVEDGEWLKNSEGARLLHALEDARAERDAAEGTLREIAAKSCGVPGHSVAVGCGCPEIARHALNTEEGG